MKKGVGDEGHRAYICATDNGTYVCSMVYLVIVKKTWYDFLKERKLNNFNYRKFFFHHRLLRFYRLFLVNGFALTRIFF